MTRATLVAIVGGLVAVVATIGSATADVKPPTGWESNPEFAAAMSPRTDLFGNLPATSTTEVYRAPIRGAVLYVTRIEATVTADQRDAAATYEVEELRRTLDRAGVSAKAQAQTQRVDPTTKLLEGTLAWRDDSAGLVNRRRVVVAADASRVVAMLGECVLATDVAPEIAKACEDSLQTIVPDVPAAQRVPLSIVSSAAAASPTSPSAPAPTGTPSTSSGPSMGDASKLPAIPPMQVTPPKAPERETDRRPVILGLGLLVMAIVFYLNRQRRERFDREDARAAGRDTSKTDESAAKPTDESTAEPVEDDDDALHAAAEPAAAEPAAAEPAAAATGEPDDSKKKGDDDTN